MSKVTSIKAGESSGPSDLNDRPINIINDGLGEAYATLDLIHTMTSHNPCAPVHLETLATNTLNTAIHSAMLRIEEALAVVNACEVMS